VVTLAVCWADVVELPRVVREAVEAKLADTDTVWVAWLCDTRGVREAV